MQFSLRHVAVRVEVSAPCQFDFFAELTAGHVLFQNRFFAEPDLSSTGFDSLIGFVQRQRKIVRNFCFWLCRVH